MTTITERALFQRLKRHMAKHYNEKLCKSREDSYMELNYGQYYTVDLWTNTIADWKIDLTERAREEKVMHPLETLAE